MKLLLEAGGLALPGRLQESTLELHEGEVACLIGPNGSGKTSLIHAIAGIGSPAGAARIDGVELRHAAPALRPRLLSFMPASRDVRWPIRARDLIGLGGATAEEVERRVRQLGLEELAERPIDSLSTGERSRVLLARSLATEPKLLLLDEPLANLDPQWQLRLIDLLRAEVAGTRKAALVAVHDLDSAERLADRLIVMSGGRIVAGGEPHEVLGSPVIAEIFGIERSAGGWRLAMRPAGPRSLQ